MFFTEDMKARVALHTAAVLPLPVLDDNGDAALYRDDSDPDRHILMGLWSQTRKRDRAAVAAVTLAADRQLFGERCSAAEGDWAVTLVDGAHTPGSRYVCTLRHAGHGVDVHVYAADWSLCTTRFVYTGSRTRVRSFRHGTGLTRQVTWTTFAALVAFLSAVHAEGPCSDPVMVVPPCVGHDRHPGAHPHPDPVLCALEDAVLNLSMLVPGVGWVPRRFVRTLPPYAPSTVAAFEAANDMAFPADLVWFLTHVSREVVPYAVVTLCDVEPGWDSEDDENLETDAPDPDPEVQEVLATHADYKFRSRKLAVAREVVALRRHGGADAGRPLRRLQPQPPGLAWCPARSRALPLMDLLQRPDQEVPDTDSDSDSDAELHRELGLDWASKRVAIAGRVAAMGLANEVAVPGFGDDGVVGDLAMNYEQRTRDFRPEFGPGLMELVPMCLGRNEAAYMVLRGPHAGCVSTSCLTHGGGPSKLIIFPSFRSYVKCCIVYDVTGTGGPNLAFAK